jgi:hypothetical protein
VDLLDRRNHLIAQLRASGAPTASIAVTPAPTAADRSADGPATPPRAAGPEWTRERVRNLLLALGVLLLAIAAVIFLVAAWGRFGISGRAGIMTLVTVLFAVGSGVASRRQLPATAEALGATTVALMLLDALALWIANPAELLVGFFGLYWALAFALITMLCVLAHRVTPLRAYRIGAALVAQLAIPIFLTDVPESRWLHIEWSASLGVQALAGLGIIAVIRRSTRWRDVGGPLAGSATLIWGAALAIAVHQAFSDGAEWDAPHWLAAVLLLGLGGVAAVAARLASAHRLLRNVAAGAAAAAVLAGAYSRTSAAMEGRWWAAAALALALSGVMVSQAIHEQWRPGIVAVLGVVTTVASLPALTHTAYAVLAPATWLRAVWDADPHTPARDVLGPALAWHGGYPTPVAVGLLALTSFAIARATTHRAPRTLAVIPAVGAGLTLPLSAGASLWWALAADLAIAAGLTVILRFAEQVPLRRTVAASAGAVTLVAFIWSLATPGTTITVTAVLLAAAAAALAAAASKAPAALATMFLAATETAAVTQYAGWDLASTGVALACISAVAVATAAVLGRSATGQVAEIGGAATLAGAILLAHSSDDDLVAVLAIGFLAAASAAARLPRWAAAAAGLLCATAFQVAVIAGAGNSGRLITLGVVGSTLMAVGVWALQRVHVTPAPVESVGAVATALAIVAIAVADLRHLWVVLLVSGVAGALQAAHPSRRVLRAVPAVLLLASSWTRLATLDVTVVEPYTLPAALLLLGNGWLVRRRVAGSSWSAYGAGLSLALVPSLLVAVHDPGTTRPVLLGLSSLGVVVIGLRRRLQAPLMLAGGVLASLAVIHLSPAFLILYASAPRWVLLGTAGAVLLVLGITYERRLRDLRQLHEAVRGLH